MCVCAHACVCVCVCVCVGGSARQAWAVLPVGCGIISCLLVLVLLHGIFGTPWSFHIIVHFHRNGTTSAIAWTRTLKAGVCLEITSGLHGGALANDTYGSLAGVGGSFAAYLFSCFCHKHVCHGHGVW